MRFSLLALVLAVGAPAAFAHDEDLPLQWASELRDWCMQESQAYFIGRDESPANWTATYTETANTFKVEGKWRVGTNDVTVECRAGRGAQRRYAKMEIGGVR